MADLKYALRQTPYGWIGALGSAQGLRSTTMPQSSAERTVEELGPGMQWAEPAEGAFEELLTKIEGFLAGEPVEFDETIDPAVGTPFVQQVWQATRQIPCGETRSYGWVAERGGRPRAARAVGRAMATNPVPPIVPCHRVIGADGGLCGYGAGGLGVKQRLLDQEAAGRALHPRSESSDHSKRDAIEPPPGY